MTFIATIFVISAAIAIADCEVEDPDCADNWSIDTPEGGGSQEPHDQNLYVSGKKAKVGSIQIKLEKETGPGTWGHIETKTWSTVFSSNWNVTFEPPAGGFDHTKTHRIRVIYDGMTKETKEFQFFED